MSQSRPVGVAIGGDASQDDADLVRWDRDVDHLLDLLTDSYCRSILEVTSSESLTAREIANRVEFPLSTTYRKLDALDDAGLLEAGVRLRDVGRNPSEYVRSVENVVVSLDEAGEVGLWVTYRDLDERSLPGDTRQDS